jgi:uncharacterized protein with FMN-binding domain
VQVGGKTVTRHYSVRYIKAITIDGKREVLGGGPVAPATPVTPAATPAPSPAIKGVVAKPAAGAQKSRKEVENIIATVGKTPPDWLEATPLNFPQTLDLSFPQKPAGAWNNQKNFGQYMWDVVNPNPAKWHEGLKLAYHLADLHKDDAEIRGRVAGQIAGMYHHLFEDHARAAYWFRQSTQYDPASLAECYWKLGNKPMALEVLNGMKSVGFSAIKLCADLGDTDRAVKIAGLFATGSGGEEANVLAGDACRMAGRTAQAIKYYEATLAAPDSNRNRRPKSRAAASLEAIRLFDLLDLKKVPDGVYTASSMGYETQVEIEVTVKAARIEDVKVTKHHEKQFYASITETPARIIAKQSVKDVDATSRATITSEAIINATAKALAGAMK